MQRRRGAAGGAAHYRLSTGHRAGLGLVFLGYLPEVLFFLFVIEAHMAIGDYELLRRITKFVE